MPALEQLKARFKSYVWKHLLSMVLGLMLLRGAKTLTALRLKESVATLSRTLNSYPWPLEKVGATRRRCRLITKALQKHHGRRRGRRPVVYLILDDTVIPKRGEKLPGVGFHFSSAPLKAEWCGAGTWSLPPCGSAT